MGLWNTIRDALGLQRPLEVVPPDHALEVSAAAQRRLDQLPEGHGVHLELSPAGPDAWVVEATEGVSQGPPPAALEPHEITISDPDLRHLSGLILDHRDGRWAVTLRLEVRARETPNPDGRQYLTSRWLALGRPLFFTAGSPAPTLPARLLELDGVQTVLLRANTVTVERAPGTPWDAIDAGVDAVVREYLLLCGRPLEDRDVPGSADPLVEEIRAVLEQRILPAIHRDGGDLELLGVQDGVVRVSMVGACRSCPSSTLTLKAGVERTLLEAFPGRVVAVEQV